MLVLIFLVSTSEGSFPLSLLPYYSFLVVHPGLSGLPRRRGGAASDVCIRSSLSSGYAEIHYNVLVGVSQAVLGPNLCIPGRYPAHEVDICIDHETIKPSRMWSSLFGGAEADLSISMTSENVCSRSAVLSEHCWMKL